MRAFMVRLTIILIILGSGPLLVAEDQAAVQWRRSRIPEWVDPLDVAELAEKSDTIGEADLLYLMVDRQINVPTGEYYIHIAHKVLNENGVRNGSQISVSFYPLFQTIDWHAINLLRNGQIYDHLQNADIKTLQQEEHLERFIYEESATLAAFLDDVRVGDIIEYSITISGRNPVFAGYFFESVIMQWSVPVEHSRFRLLYPKARHLDIEEHEVSYEATVDEYGETREYLWQALNLPAIGVEDSSPYWYNPYPWICLTEFETWAQFMSWVEPLYTAPQALSQPLQEKIEEFRRQNTSLEEKIIAAVRFVQDEIRYLGMELGEAAYKPADPSDVFARRYGDCKDKSLLLCTILSRLDVDSHPVLIAPRHRMEGRSLPPSPLHFDHVIVKIDFQGETYWADPTIASQRGSLEDLRLPWSALGFVIDDRTDPLPVELDVSSSGAIEAGETYRIEDYSGEAYLGVKITYRNHEADFVRSYFANIGTSQMETDYLNWLAQSFPEIRQVSPIAIDDDPEENVIKISMSYRIKNLWRETGESELVAEFYSVFMYDYLIKPAVVVRKTPFAIPYPTRIQHTMDISLPEDIEMEDLRQTIENDFFLYKTAQNMDHEMKKIRLSYELDTLSDSVPPESIAAYLKDVDLALNLSSLIITIPRDSPDQLPVQKWAYSDFEGSEPPGASALAVSLSTLSLFVMLLVRMILSF